MSYPSLGDEHPTLTGLAMALIDVVRSWSGEIHVAAGASAWMHHMDFTKRTESLGDHLDAAMVLADTAHFHSALALTRTALEHHLIDRLLLLADRYEEVVRPPDADLIDEWEAEWRSRSAAWTRDVESVERVRNGAALRLVRLGYKVRDDAGDIQEQISPYWSALENYDAFAGHPDLQAETVRPFLSPDDREDWARRNQAIYGAFLRWRSICSNLELSQLTSTMELVQLQVHYSFLSAFTHASNSGYEVNRLARLPGPSAAHLLGELAALYAIVLAAAEIRAWSPYMAQRPRLLAPLSPETVALVDRAEDIAGYFWFLVGGPQLYDFCQEANGRAHPRLLAGDRPDCSPADLSPGEVGYYPNPFERLARMHIGEREMMTGFGFPPAWTELHW